MDHEEAEAETLRAQHDGGGGRAAGFNVSFTVTNIGGAIIVIPPDADRFRRVVTFEGTAELVDSDSPDDDDVGTFSFIRQCSVDPFSLSDSTTWGGPGLFCVDEMRAEALWQCALVMVPMATDPTRMVPTGEVRVTARYRLYEEDSCGEDDLDDEITRTIVLPACAGGCSLSLSAFLDNLGEVSLDSATFTVNAMSNVQL